MLSVSEEVQALIDRFRLACCRDTVENSCLEIVNKAIIVQFSPCIETFFPTPQPELFQLVLVLRPILKSTPKMDLCLCLHPSWMPSFHSADISSELSYWFLRNVHTFRAQIEVVPAWTVCLQAPYPRLDLPVSRSTSNVQCRGFLEVVSASSAWSCAFCSHRTFRISQRTLDVSLRLSSFALAFDRHALSRQWHIEVPWIFHWMGFFWVMRRKLNCSNYFIVKNSMNCWILTLSLAQSVDRRAETAPTMESTFSAREF